MCVGNGCLYHTTFTGVIGAAGRKLSFFANFPPLQVKPGSMGKPSPGFDVSVIDHDGNELPPNQEGDIAVRVKPERPTWMFQEYWPDTPPQRMRGVLGSTS